MSELIATFTDVSEWNVKNHYNTGGTRSKKVIVNPSDEELYFFKGSKQTRQGEIRYEKEFWSEIVASKVGQLLGFDMLDYNIAYNHNHVQKIGCISKSMVDLSLTELSEGKNFLTGFDSGYNPDNPLDKTKYTFEFICDALAFHNLQMYIPNIVNIIVFDCIIGNSDRHQENWAIIVFSAEFLKAKEVFSKEVLPTKLLFRDRMAILNDVLLPFFYKKEKPSKEIIPIKKLNGLSLLHEFSPIYDSGCCLGREFNDDKVMKIISDNQMIDAYINKGKSEIHWENKKRKHFELLDLIKGKYETEVKGIINDVRLRYSEKKIFELIQNIDSQLPTGYIKYKLGNERKDLMYKLITLRIDKLLERI